MNNSRSGGRQTNLLPFIEACITCWPSVDDDNCRLLCLNSLITASAGIKLTPL
mgnify:FL=1|jgi:hypothetical protein